jgi:hypothetical protein
VRCGKGLTCDSAPQDENKIEEVEEDAEKEKKKEKVKYNEFEELNKNKVYAAKVSMGHAALGLDVELCCIGRAFSITAPPGALPKGSRGSVIGSSPIQSLVIKCCI